MPQGIINNLRGRLRRPGSRSLLEGFAHQFCNSFGDIVGDAEVFAEETHFAGDLVVGLSSFARTIQNGKTQQYALYMALGLVLAITFVLVGS